MLSIIILTKNEEKDLPQCLKSLQWCDDIYVLDSGSKDNTISIAKSYGAQVSYNRFESFGKQRNYALDHLDLKYDWVLFLDADEVATPKFRFAIKKAILESADNIAGYYCCWKMILEERWLKYSDNFPKWQLRLVRKGRISFTDFGHGQKEDKIFGETDYIKEPYMHYSFSKGWKHWIERHNKYSSLEAYDRLYNSPSFNKIFSRNSSQRNPALKSWLSRVPGWPLLRFVYTYFFNGGFLEGIPGFIYCVNIAYYEFLIKIKIRELKRQELGSRNKKAKQLEVYMKI
ncbi:glycosyltransferase family 2 protein [Salinimicrobium sp. GXAS 041]|uniref:glycosyltransferase family 2 protein n=1 Tax=Salinimicrobium sp. GXAS 041 TaxID=3400806 RepID=UPI003C73C85F